MNSAKDTPQVALGGWVAPFGDPGITDRSHLPRAFRSVPRPSSPLSAKASTRCPYFALDRRHPSVQPRFCNHGCATRRRTTAAHRTKTPMGQNPKRRRSRMKTLLRTRIRHRCQNARPPRSHHNSLSSLFNQHPPQVAPQRPRVLFSEHPRGQHGRRRRRAAPGVGRDRASPREAGGEEAGGRRARPVVEVNGIEPMTSCLQSRRSPS